MGKKKERSVGTTLIKDHLKSHKRRVPKKDSWLHTTEMNDVPYPGYDARLEKLKSCTEQSALMEFLSTAELAGQDFTAQRDANVRVIDPKSVGVLARSDVERRRKVQEKKKEFLKVPRRPHWDEKTTPQELELAERDAFVKWRRELSALQEDEDVIVTPFEKNLELWRQLWRVVERSDVLVQIVDARNPLLFYCPDLETYVRETNPNKICLVLVNKSDLLTQRQRRIWADYFKAKGMKVVFWSALTESEKVECGDFEQLKNDKGDEIQEDAEEEYSSDEWETEEEMSDEDYDDDDAQLTDSRPRSSSTIDFVIEGVGRGVAGIEIIENERFHESRRGDAVPLEDEEVHDEDDEVGKDSLVDVDDLVDIEQLLAFIKSVYVGETMIEGVTTVGLVGYPNVGKSSTINAILRSKKVAVSATPGKTKHFQTIYVDSSLLLCDCPGLVFPSFVTSKEELVLSGILPVDQLRDHVSPVNLLCTRISRDALQSFYGVRIPPPREGEDEDRSPTAEEFLSVYGTLRGFMTSQGRPDCPKTARIVLKDHVNGKLLYCHPPPGVEAADFEEAPEWLTSKSLVDSTLLRAKKKPLNGEVDELDREFFEECRTGFGTRGKRTNATVSGDEPGKPWKKHNNRNKKEKLRRVFGYLDQ